MGNHNSGGRHHLRNRRNGETEVQVPHSQYGPPSNQAPQIPSSSITHNQMAVVSLPYSQVDCNLRALAGQAEGFGRFAVGGLNGPLYHVTTLSGLVSLINDRS